MLLLGKLLKGYWLEQGYIFIWHYRGKDAVAVLGYERKTHELRVISEIKTRSRVLDWYISGDTLLTYEEDACRVYLMKGRGVFLRELRCPKADFVETWCPDGETCYFYAYSGRTVHIFELKGSSLVEVEEKTYPHRVLACDHEMRCLKKRGRFSNVRMARFLDVGVLFMYTKGRAVLKIKGDYKTFRLERPPVDLDISSGVLFMAFGDKLAMYDTKRGFLRFHDIKSMGVYSSRKYPILLSEDDRGCVNLYAFNRFTLSLVYRDSTCE